MRRRSRSSGVSLRFWGGPSRSDERVTDQSDSTKGTDAMTHDHSALLTQLDALKSADSGPCSPS